MRTLLYSVMYKINPWDEDTSVLSKCTKLTPGMRTLIRTLVWSQGGQNVCYAKVQQCSTVPRPHIRCRDILSCLRGKGCARTVIATMRLSEDIEM